LMRTASKMYTPGGVIPYQNNVSPMTGAMSAAAATPTGPAHLYGNAVGCWGNGTGPGPPGPAMPSERSMSP
jgi:hypothetical protein